MEIERYEPKEETKIMKALDQVFDRTHSVTEEDAILGKDINKAVEITVRDKKEAKEQINNILSRASI